MQTLISNHYPPVIKQIKEMQQIIKAEDLEFRALYEAMDKINKNMFLLLADMEGIQKFETLFGIPYNGLRSIEERRAYILYKANRKKMNLSQLTEIIINYQEGVALEPDYKYNELLVTVPEYANDLKTIYEILDGVLPLQISIYFALPVVICLLFAEAQKKLVLKSCIDWLNSWKWTVCTEEKTSVQIVESFEAETIITQKDLWNLDGSIQLDGSKYMDAEKREEKFDMATKAVTTTIAKKKILLARAGEHGLPKIAKMAFGNGGTGQEGDVLEPDGERQELNHEILRKDIDKYEIISDTQIQYYCTLKENELAGMEISELALVDEDGDLVAVKNFLPKGKDDDWEMVFKIGDTM